MILGYEFDPKAYANTKTNFTVASFTGHLCSEFTRIYWYGPTISCNANNYQSASLITDPKSLMSM